MRLPFSRPQTAEKTRLPVGRAASAPPGAAAGDVFTALADPTRRRLLERVSEEGPISATDLAVGMPITRQAVVKHLSALGAAGLLHAERRGREVLFTVEPGTLQLATDWLERIGREWDRRLVALVKHLTPTTPAGTGQGPPTAT